MPKRPSFQFYPSDWLRDTALRSCSTGARGLWIDMICFMHEGNPYGHLKVGDKVIHPVNLARMVGETLEVVEGWLKELHHAGVYDLTEDGTICSRRMIRDENLRKIRALGGKLGGNPALINGDKVNLNVKQKVKQKSTPSSSSSSSSSKEKPNDVERPDDIPEDLWIDFQKHRKGKNAQITARVINNLRKESAKANISLSDVMEKMIVNNWQGFQAEWVKPKETKQTDWWMNDRRIK
jgi:hypothetical protein